MSQRDDIFGLMIPKTVMGFAVWILMFGLGAAVSGLIFFAVYQSRINAVESRVIRQEERIDKKVNARLDEFRNQFKNTQDSGNLKVSSVEEDKLLQSVQSSIARVEAPGRGGKGLGFVVKSTAGEAWIVTSNHLVSEAAAAKKPVQVRLNGSQQDSNVLVTDPGHDLALIIFKGGTARGLEFATSEPKPGDKVFAGVLKSDKTADSKMMPGRLTKASSFGLLSDINYSPSQDGGPLLDSDAKVVGMLSSTYLPTGQAASTKWAIPIRLSCNTILKCTKAGSDKPAPGPSPLSGTSGPPAAPPENPGTAPVPPRTDPNAPPAFGY